MIVQVYIPLTRDDIDSPDLRANVYATPTWHHSERTKSSPAATAAAEPADTHRRHPAFVTSKDTIAIRGKVYSVVLPTPIQPNTYIQYIHIHSFYFRQHGPYHNTDRRI